MTNVIGLRRSADSGRLVGPLHAVDGGAGEAARGADEQVGALCGEQVQVVGVEDVPDDAGLCQACRYGG